MSEAPQGPEAFQSRYATHELLGPLVVTYIEELPQVLRELGEAVEQGSEVLIHRLSHRLTGDAAAYGFSSLSEAARALELAAPGERAATWQQVAYIGRMICGAT